MNVTFQPLSIKRDWPFIQKLHGAKLHEDTTGIIAVDADTGSPAAFAIFDSWSYTSVQVHLTIMRSSVIRRGFFQEIARYVYDVCQRKVMIALVPSDNEQALKLDKHIGFKELFRVKDGFNDGVDYVVMELRKDEISPKWYTPPVKELREVN